jgi:hypothetical protein
MMGRATLRCHVAPHAAHRHCPARLSPCLREAEFEAICGRVQAKGLPYGSGPFNHTDGQLYTHRGVRGFYFEDPYSHLLEVMTVPETGN